MPPKSFLRWERALHTSVAQNFACFNYQYVFIIIIVVDQAEMEVVKTGMQHGDLSLDAYTQVTSIPYFWFLIIADIC